ncbi:MAG: SOS response-associated peptidase [Polyangiaceae bacterium]|nr:SOS response-associated peptidase [Polyangiaceae bacterium]
MCARFTLAVPDLAALARALAAGYVAPALEGLYPPCRDVAPSDVHPLLVARAGRRELVPATFGIAAPWLGHGRLVNARSESARVKPAFRGAFARRRCVVPADGFYEWPRAQAGARGARRPLWFAPRSGGLLHLAGLYEVAEGPAAGDVAPAFVVLTTAPNATVAAVHDRMPAILDPADVDAWLDVEGAAPARVEALLRPAPPGLLAGRPAARRVSEETDAQGTLPLFGRPPR